ncbi:MAG: protein kinase domain-containing protein, partial [Gemmataceae bacterium]
IIDRKGPFSFEEAAKIAAQTAAGLQHAHEKGFVHRDIKPENLMLTRNGVVKILDMGLTKSFTRPEDNLTGIIKADVILGTIDYLSPEQAIQSGVDARSDIYSLGATLFTVLCGYSPYEGTPPKQKLMQHQFGAVPNVQKFRPDVPDELAAIVTRMMAKKPDDRFASSVDVIQALAPWAGDEAVPNSILMPSSVMKSPTNMPSQTPTTAEANSQTRPILPENPRPANSKPKTEFPSRADFASPLPQEKSRIRPVPELPLPPTATLPQGAAPLDPAELAFAQAAAVKKSATVIIGSNGEEIRSSGVIWMLVGIVLTIAGLGVVAFFLYTK